MDIYRSRNFQYVDPVILTALKRTSPFSWNENITLISKEIFDMAKEHNMPVNGYTFFLNDHLNNLATLSLVIDKSIQKEREPEVIKNRASFQMMLIEIYEKMNELNDSLSQLPSRKKRSRLIVSLFSHQEKVRFCTGRAWEGPTVKWE